MKYLNTYKLFESLYNDNEYIDTGVLLDILQDLTIEKGIDVYVNKLLSYGDYRDIPKSNIGTGYIKMGKGKDDRFGVYDIKFVIPLKVIDSVPQEWEHNKLDYIWDSMVKPLCKDAVRFYNSQSDHVIVAFINNGNFIDVDETNIGKIYYIRVYFTRTELFKYVLTQFHKTYSIV